MGSRLKLGGVVIDVMFRDIKNVHLSVHPPTGRIRISAPAKMKLDTVRVFAISKLDWIKRQRHRFKSQERESVREYCERESHYVWGKRYLLKIVEQDAPPAIELQYSHMVLKLRPKTSFSKRAAVVEEWYRGQIKAAAQQLIAKWEPQLSVSLKQLFIRRMKTKWGSCNPGARSIRLNTELARKPRNCLEYIIVHELAHLIEPTHNVRFVDLIDQIMPQWRLIRDELNRAPLAHEKWAY